MNSYTLEVTQDNNPQKINTYTINSDRKLDKRILQVVGLILDGGISKETLELELPTAQMYVDVIGKTKKQNYLDVFLQGN